MCLAETEIGNIFLIDGFVRHDMKFMREVTVDT